MSNNRIVINTDEVRSILKIIEEAREHVLGDYNKIQKAIANAHENGWSDKTFFNFRDNTLQPYLIYLQNIMHQIDNEIEPELRKILREYEK